MEEKLAVKHRHTFAVTFKIEKPLSFINPLSLIISHHPSLSILSFSAIAEEVVTDPPFSLHKLPLLLRFAHNFHLWISFSWNSSFSSPMATTHHQDSNPNTPAAAAAPPKQAVPAAKTVDTQSVLKRYSSDYSSLPFQFLRSDFLNSCARWSICCV